MTKPGLRALFMIAGMTLAACAVAPPVKPAREAHGMADAFAAPGVALAWGILRGASEAETIVVMRIATDRTAYPWFAVVGSDPFTQARHPVFPPTRSADVTHVRAPRSHYAEFPRTEVRLYESGSAALKDIPALVVFFLGVPDTTPEFATEDKLEAYLRQRLARALEPAG